MTGTLLAVTAAALVGPHIVAQARAVLLSEAPSGVVAIDDEGLVRVEGLRGALQVRGGEGGQLEFLCVNNPEERREVPVRLWREGGALVFRPPEREPEQPQVPPRVLWVSVPPSLPVTAQGLSGEFLGFDLRSSLEIAGGDLAVQARRLHEGFAAELQTGSLALYDVRGGLSLAGKGLEGSASRVEGEVSLALEGSRLTLRQVSGGVVGQLENTTLVLEDVKGVLDLDADGGALQLARVQPGGQLRLSRASLEVRACKGDFEVETDGSVEVADTDAGLHIDAYGAPISGANLKGLVEIRNDHASVRLDTVSAPLRIQGQDLEIVLRGLAGEALVMTEQSDVRVDTAFAKLEIHNDWGSVRVARPRGAVTIRSSGGDVTVSEAGGPVDVEADGEAVEVSWIRLPKDENSVVRNAGGDVTVVLPARARCRLELETRYGRIESEYPEVRVSASGQRGLGMLQRARRPVIQIRAEGDIRILRPDASRTRK